MTIQEYEDIKIKVLSGWDRTYEWELLKAIWELTKVVKGGLDE